MEALVQPLPRDRSVDLVPRGRRLRRPGDLKRVMFGLLLLTLMVATHARGEVDLDDPNVFGRVLAAYVGEDGLVDYAGLAGDQAAVASLRAKGNMVGHADPSAYEPADRLAYLINAYNATVLQVLLDAGAGTPPGPESILDLDGGEVFDKQRVMLGLKQVSLNQLEKEHIAPLAGDARYHFAINCGALSCPPLRAEAYTGEKLQEQLDDQRDRTLDRGDDRFIVWKGDGAVEVTKVMDWYGEEFGDVAAYLNEHAKLPGKAAKVGFLEYDWSLNAQRSRK